MSINLELPQCSQEKMRELLQKQREFYFRLNHLEKHTRTARKIGVKTCVKCASCCWQNPCDLNREDLINISEYLGYKNVKDFFKEKIVIQYYAQLKKYIIVPVRKGFKAGVFNLPENWFKLEPCVFLEKNLCTINDVKPKCGKDMNFWEDIDDISIGIFYSKEELTKILEEFDI